MNGRKMGEETGCIRELPYMKSPQKGKEGVNTGKISDNQNAYNLRTNGEGF